MAAKNRPGSRRPIPAGPVEKPRDQVQQETGSARAGTAKRFPIVGIGASAGGLEAFTRLLQNLPKDTGMGFVLVQHLDPAHASALTQLLSKATALPVREATQDVLVERNHVYVIAPNTNLTIARGVLKLHPRQAGRGVQRSIDFFFESLAHDQHECAIGVILSGTASDGTLGLEAIKAEGGITLAQDETAHFQSMPHSAIAAGCVDFVLSPKNIALELTRIAKHPFVAGGTHADLAAPRAHPSPHPCESVMGDEDGYKKIVVLLRNHSSVDFSLYKASTIQRRIARRMVLKKLTTLDDYAQFLQGKPKELDELYADVLISVTGFFRNPETFEFLKRKIFAKILPERRDEPLRVWVLGCSTGQEVYSLAMSLAEFFDDTPRAPKIQIFASDLNEACLDKARAGRYAKSVVHDISPQRLRRFFVEEEGSFRVIKSLRESIIFARHNLMSDPPFSRMNLVSCRNLLIYLESSVQTTVMPTFHYALKPNGCLFLGASETTGAFTHLFEQVDKKHKIYIKKPGPSPALRLQRTPKQVEAGKQSAVSKSAAAPEELPVEINAQREADRITRNHYAPPSVLVNAESRVLEFRGHTNPFLEPPSGQANFNVLKMAREGLMLPLRAALKKAKKENKVVRRENVLVNQNGQGRTVHVEVVPLKNLKERYYLIFFEDAAKPQAARSWPSAPPPQQTSKRDSRRIKELETELAETRDYLQSVEEQHAAAIEKVQSSDQETTSTNEELQSINEELETSAEELESTNEELTTVNEEMDHRNKELHRLNSDLTNLQTSTHLGIVLLGPDLTLRRFSAQAEKQFNLRATDIGRHISDIRNNLFFPDQGLESDRSAGPAKTGTGSGPLETLIARVIDTVREHECEVFDNDGGWYSLRVRPYISLDGKVDGAVLVLVNIDALKKSEREISLAREYAEGIVETVRESLLVLDGELRVKSANQSFYRTFHAEPVKTIGKLIFELGNHQWDIPKLRELLEDILPRNSHFEDFEVDHGFEQLGRCTMLLNARRLHAEGSTQRILLAIEDVTEQMRREQELQAAYVAEAVIHTARDPLVILDADLRIHSASEAFYKTFSLSPAQAEGHLMFELGNGQWNIPHLRRLVEEIIPRDSFFNDLEITVELESGRRRTFLFDGRMLKEHTDKILLSAQDITEVLTFQTELRRTEIRYRRLFEAAKDGVLILEPEKRKILDANPFMTELLGYTRNEMLGMELFEIGLLKDEETTQAMFRELWKHATIRFADLPIRSKTKEQRFVEMVSNLYEENGDKVIQCNIRDITERKQREEELRRAQEQLANRAGQLEQAVAERTAELTASNKELEAFVYTVAHDLRAPLRSMQSFSALLLEEAEAALGETGRDFANRVKLSAQFMDALLADLLAFSRLSQQRMELVPLNLETVVRSVVSRLEKEMQEKKAKVEILAPWPDVLAYEPMLAQVLLNLVSNALKFVPPDVPPLIRLRAEAHGRLVRVWVEDNGIGIAPEHQEQIFRPFLRLHGERYGGTGIGLAIVQKGIERMGGRIGVDSAAGRGSRFWFELPKS